MPQIFLSHFISVLVTALSNERIAGLLLGVRDLQILSCSQALVPSTPKVSSHRITESFCFMILKVSSKSNHHQEMLLPDRLLSPTPELGWAHWPGHDTHSLSPNTQEHCGNGAY